MSLIVAPLAAAIVLTTPVRLPRPSMSLGSKLPLLSFWPTVPNDEVKVPRLLSSF